MFIINKLISRRINKKISKGCNRQALALDCFNRANSFLYGGRIKKAQGYMRCYRKLIDYDTFLKIDNRKDKLPELSVIIVAYRTNKLLLDCISSVIKNREKVYEIIIVDNGGNDDVEDELKKMEILYIKTPQNLIPSEGRNIGVHFARGKIIAFLDDDALVAENYVKTVSNAFSTYDICGFRGRVLPKGKTSENKRIQHYDLGGIPVPSIINIEGNSAFRKSVYLEMNGMDPLLFGHEGWDLSLRIAGKYGSESLIYWPETVIYHDYSDNMKRRDNKRDRHSIMSDFVKRKNRKAAKYRRKLKKYIQNEQTRVKGERLLKRRIGE
ncbi:MAG: glycosyltransferase [Candidatus Krumholzibacteriota bacterium]|nr:glycosyltransferase [Candidatus Krumholzibacteriota bacterium]